MSGVKEKFSMEKWVDDWKMAGQGIFLATREKIFWAWFLPVFIALGILLNLLANGTASFALMANSDLSGKLNIIGKAALGLVGVGKNFGDFLYVFLITLLQAILIAAIAVVYKYNKMSAKNRAKKNSEGSDDPNEDGVSLGDAAQNSGIVAGLAILGSGCPTCGTSLLAPLLASTLSAGGFMIANMISGIITGMAIVLAIHSLKKVGLDSYVLIKAEKRRKNARKNR
ncbi:MAG: hypothetical protein Q4F60_01615 [Candidatus Saccharibacteria bacterium]|nr:hypothetical protein [Candidatus Saccharibacteria bacterium]